MNGLQLTGLAPLLAQGLGAVAAMLLAPLARPRDVRIAAAAGLLAAAALVLMRAGAAPAPLSTLFADDGLARFGIVFASLTAFAALLLIRVDPVAQEAPALVALGALGAAALAGAQNAATLFLGLELSALPLVTLFAFERSRPGLEAGYKFLVMSGLASAALLLGVALLYAATGSLSFAEWNSDTALPAIGGALVLAGLAFKFSLVPFHMWMPDAFEGAPAGAAALAGVASKAAVAIALLRIGLEVPPPEPLWTKGLALFGAASVVLGNLAALRQPGFSRMLGYSAVAHSGYVALILASGVVRAGEATLFYLTAYAPALIAALCLAGAVGPTATLTDLRGLARRDPIVSTILLLALLSLAGLPPTGGFIAKVYLFTTLADGRHWLLLAIAAAGSALGFYYYARFFTALFLGQGDRDPPSLQPRNRALLGVCTAAILLLGLAPAGAIAMLRSVLPLISPITSLQSK